MISISTTLFDLIKDHAIRDYPNECCGGLLGTYDPESDEKMVRKVIGIDNNWQDSVDENKRRRFMVSTQDYTMLEKKAHNEGVQLLGFYHSHPDHPPEPSQTDLSYAWPFFSYPILSIYDNEPKDIKSYILNLEGQKLIEEIIKIF